MKQLFMISLCGYLRPAPPVLEICSWSAGIWAEKLNILIFVGSVVSRAHAIEFRLVNAMPELGQQAMVPSLWVWKLPQDQPSFLWGPQGEAGRELGNEIKFYPLESDFNLAAHQSTAKTSRKPQRSWLLWGMSQSGSHCAGTRVVTVLVLCTKGMFHPMDIKLCWNGYRREFCQWEKKTGLSEEGVSMEAWCRPGSGWREVKVRLEIQCLSPPCGRTSLDSGG